MQMWCFEENRKNSRLVVALKVLVVELCNADYCPRFHNHLVSLLRIFQCTFQLLWISDHCVWNMDAVTLHLQEVGVIKVISEQEAANTAFDVIFGNSTFSNPKDRFKYVATVLQPRKDKSPVFSEPGTSLCESCKHISLDRLCRTEGYIHSECY